MFLCFIIHLTDVRTITTLRPLSHFASKYKGPFSMDYRERGSHARGVYHTQDTSLMTTARVKEDSTARGRSTHKNNGKRVVKYLEERNVGTKLKSSKQGLTSAEDLTDQ